MKEAYEPCAITPDYGFSSSMCIHLDIDRYASRRAFSLYYFFLINPLNISGIHRSCCWNQVCVRIFSSLKTSEWLWMSWLEAKSFLAMWIMFLHNVDKVKPKPSRFCAWFCCLAIFGGKDGRRGTLDSGGVGTSNYSH